MKTTPRRAKVTVPPTVARRAEIPVLSAMPIFQPNSAHPRSLRFGAVALLSLVFAASAAAQAGTGGGSQGSTTPPGASVGLKRIADRTDPIGFLLDKKKPLEMSKEVEDSLKNYRKEMKRMQDVVFKDLDKAALKKEAGALPAPTVLMELNNDAQARVVDIQAAYRDRARGLLNPSQTHRIDSLEAIWKRDEATLAADTTKKPIRPMGRGGRGGPPPPRF